MEFRGRLMGSIRTAMSTCDYDGIEFDWEGPPTPHDADLFTSFLIELRGAVGSHAVISADSENPTFAKPDYWGLNATKMDGINLDWVNYMIYEPGNGNGTIGGKYEWLRAASTLLERGYPPSTINLGIPMYAKSNGAAWHDLCQACPDIDAASTSTSPNLHRTACVLSAGAAKCTTTAVPPCSWPEAGTRRAMVGWV